MIEKQIHEIKLDIGRKEHKASNIHNEIPNHQNKK